MKVLYDHQVFTTQDYGGVSRYFVKLLSEYQDMSGITTKSPFMLSNNYYISDNNLTTHLRFFPNTGFRGQRRVMMMFSQRRSIELIKQRDFDLFHPTYFNPYFLKYIGNKPFVVTVYDMIHEKFSELFQKKDKTSEWKKMLVQKAKKVIVISESTKHDLIELFGTDESKIEVIYLANSLNSEGNCEKSFFRCNKYIFFVGSRDGYKNFDCFIRAITPLLIKDKKLLVVCAGGGDFKRCETDMFTDLGINDQLFQFNLSDQELANVYSNAKMMVFPSLYEGFGIPVLESFSSGCPLVCSDASSLPEIAQNGAFYFNPNNEESIKEAVSQVLSNKQLRDKLVVNGKHRLNDFSWSNTALKTKEIYEYTIS